MHCEAAARFLSVAQELKLGKGCAQVLEPYEALKRVHDLTLTQEAACENADVVRLHYERVRCWWSWDSNSLPRQDMTIMDWLQIVFQERIDEYALHRYGFGWWDALAGRLN